MIELSPAELRRQTLSTLPRIFVAISVFAISVLLYQPAAKVGVHFLTFTCSAAAFMFVGLSICSTVGYLLFDNRNALESLRTRYGQPVKVSSHFLFQRFILREFITN